MKLDDVQVRNYGTGWRNQLESGRVAHTNFGCPIQSRSVRLSGVADSLRRTLFPEFIVTHVILQTVAK